MEETRSSRLSARSCRLIDSLGTSVVNASRRYFSALTNCMEPGSDLSILSSALIMLCRFPQASWVRWWDCLSFRE
jgi:hypothetical protein